MPPLGSRFGVGANEALSLSAMTEAIRANPAYRHVKRLLPIPRVEMVYELSFLRLFASWEAFIEDALLHMLCGYASPLYMPAFQPGVAREKDLGSARAAVYRGRNFKLWYDPAVVQRRCVRFLIASPQELVSASSAARLEWFAWIRHRIAHDSEDARQKFDVASMNLAGRRFPRSRPGKLLRSIDAGSNVLFLISIANELRLLAAQIAP